MENKFDYSQKNPDYAEVFVGETEKEIVCEAMDELNLNWSYADEPRGSSDIGNLDTMLPVFTPVISTGREDIKLYSSEFAELMKGREGTYTMITGAKVMGKIITKIADNPKILEKIKEEHSEYRNR